MKKVNFKPGDRVAIIAESKLTEGKVENIYACLDTPVMTVRFDDGSYAKLPIDEVIKVEEKEEPKEPVLKDEILLTQDRFKDLSSGVLAEYVRETKEEDTAIACALLLGIICYSLFTDSDND